jgi:methanogenic corrinoid protein MtbC1
MDDEARSPLSPQGMRTLRAVRDEAVRDAMDAFYAVHGPAYERFGDAGRTACREDMAFHLDFLETALEFGSAAPFTEYLRWLRSVLEARAIPSAQLIFSVELLVKFLQPLLEAADRDLLLGTYAAARTALQAPSRQAAAVPETCAVLRDALVGGDRRGALKLLDDPGEPGADLFAAQASRVHEAMVSVGRGWQANRISVAQEHLATATAQTVMVQKFSAQEPAAPNGKRVMLACVEGNHHALGLRMVADAFELAGWQVACLGPNTPARFLVDMALKEPPDLIGLSASLPHHLRAAREAIGALRAKLGAGAPPILLGGQVVNQFSRIARVLGADLILEDVAACSRFARTEAHTEARA